MKDAVGDQSELWDSLGVEDEVIKTSEKIVLNARLPWQPDIRRFMQRSCVLNIQIVSVWRSSALIFHDLDIGRPPCSRISDSICLVQ